MKKVVCAVNGDNQENSIINANANTFGISPLFAEILYSRGLTEEKQIRRFLNPSVKNLKSPFLLNGIADATERIAMAKENGEPVLIFGDYDADVMGVENTDKRIIPRARHLGDVVEGRSRPWRSPKHVGLVIIVDGLDHVTVKNVVILYISRSLQDSTAFQIKRTV